MLIFYDFFYFPAFFGSYFLHTVKIQVEPTEPIGSLLFVAISTDKFPVITISRKFIFFIHISNIRRVKNNLDRKSTRLNSSHVKNSSAVFCLKKKITYTV